MRGKCRARFFHGDYARKFQSAPKPSKKSKRNNKKSKSLTILKRSKKKSHKNKRKSIKKKSKILKATSNKVYYLCPKCRFRYYDLHLLESHIRRAHANQYHEPIETLLKQAIDKKHKAEKKKDKQLKKNSNTTKKKHKKPNNHRTK